MLIERLIPYFKRRGKYGNLLEAIGLSLLALFCAISLKPADPYSLFGPFSWLTLVPVFCSLWYGILNGLISLVILLVYLLFHQFMDQVDNMTLIEYCAGISCLTLLAGLFNWYWHSRVRDGEYLNRYTLAKLDSLSLEYYQLKISHERLEQAFIVKPLSFREAFFQIKQELVKNDGDINKNICERLLNIFSQYCSIDSATLCLYHPKQKSLEPLAFLGSAFEVNIKDPLIIQALQTCQLSHIPIKQGSVPANSQYIGVIPILNSHHRVKALVIIREMPFASLTHENLEVLSIFATIFSIHWEVMRKIERLLDIFPSCPPDFMYQLKLLVSLKRSHHIESSLAGLIIPHNAKQETILYGLENTRRSLDDSWLLPLEHEKLYIVLLPLTSQLGLIGYKKRLASWFKTEFNEGLNQGGYHFRYQILNNDPVNEQLNEFIQACIHERQ